MVVDQIRRLATVDFGLLEPLHPMNQAENDAQDRQGPVCRMAVAEPYSACCVRVRAIASGVHAGEQRLRRKPGIGGTALEVPAMTTPRGPDFSATGETPQYPQVEKNSEILQKRVVGTTRSKSVRSRVPG